MTPESAEFVPEESGGLAHARPARRSPRPRSGRRPRRARKSDHPVRQAAAVRSREECPSRRRQETSRRAPALDGPKAAVDPPPLTGDLQPQLVPGWFIRGGHIPSVHYLAALASLAPAVVPGGAIYHLLREILVNNKRAAAFAMQRLGCPHPVSSAAGGPLRLDQVRLVVQVQQHGLVEGEVLRHGPAMPPGQGEILAAELLHPPGILLLPAVTLESTHWPPRR